ncbi:uncharacterized protein M6B38_416520 [Iris pallida]|uniref:Uncharacterized protein n=1 Tax=Iris pallida TaxID=29817 RepID=A0AAX6FJ40_IRIPA|nr:uncharacterized protein M6B38_416520 [Iris pallida]
MSSDGGGRSKRQLVFLASISLQLINGLADDPSNSKHGAKSETPSKSTSNTGLDVLLILLGVAAVVILSIFLFKLWQKKKREAQQARLLRLFEEDDELEVELGLRD